MTAAADLRETQKNYGTKAMTLAIGIGMIFLIIGNRAVCRGVVMGALFSTVNFVLMARTLHTKMGHDRTRATLSALVNIFFRYLIMAVPLFLAIKLSMFDLAATIAGLFAVQAVILAENFSRNCIMSWKK